MRKTVGVIGGGAAGMMAAITAARQGARVTVLEGNDRVGKKILSTGNGKCNLGNRKQGLEEYHTEQPERLRKCLERFGTEDTIAFFQGIGLLIKEKNGYLYPACEQASAVLDVLRFELAALGVQVITGCKVVQILPGQKAGRDLTEDSRSPSSRKDSRIRPQGGQIAVKSEKQTFRFDSVVIACGGKAAPKTGSDGSGFQLAEQIGHKLIPTVPALVQLRCDESYLKAVSGVRADAMICVWNGGKCVACERGELQLTDQGISGIPVFQLSRQVNYILQKQREVEVTVDFLPDYGQEEYEALQVGRKLLQSDRTVEEFFTGLLHKKLMQQFVKLAGLKPGEPAGTADEDAMRRVYGLCREWRVHVTGHHSYDSAQACAGGVPLDQVTEDLESCRAPGVFFAGEILDVDGKCGGYNLQWAWCSGYLAGKAAADVSGKG
ncbi:MAG: aminoacetone oxidase family FAD-binding enzyme [Lachnospiraceae bacterium]|nr:aminoacetone oxidase family FAD-binding enzyme [Butyrivibrio sp.]MCM1343792.1 aminoacetone oxidase family FAD-binding enzyme [Muribaculaceae bacterium]MCM1411323.1 aminoacetone oxidase family FAD-binding enzyme [Lachnospiraceae bacterium]